MRMLLVASALPSHFFAMAPLGWAARAAGHDVYVAVPPALCDAVAASGLPTVPAGRPMDFSGAYRRSRPASGSADPKALFAEVAEDMAADLAAFARQWGADLVVWEPTCFAGPVAAAAAGIPSVRYLWGLDIVGRGGSSRDRMPGRVRELFRQYGTDLEEVPEWLTVDPCPPSLQVPVSAPWQAVRYVPHAAASRIPAPMLAPPGPPRVVITFGLAATGLADAHAGLAPAAARALATAQVRTVVAVPAAQAPALTASGPLPANATVVTDCPLPVLLRGAAAVIHHGGAGTMLSAALAAVPQLALSVMPDLAFYGQRLAATGAGLHLPAAGVDPAAIRDAATALCRQPEFGMAAISLRAEALDQPTPAELVPRLAELAAQAARRPAHPAA